MTIVKQPISDAPVTGDDDFAPFFRHTCMSMRGVQKLQSRTVTISVLGELKNPENKHEFLQLIQK